MTPTNPGLIQVASQAQQMAKNANQDRMAFAFQTVAMVSMAVMGATAAAHLIRDLFRSEKGRDAANAVGRAVPFPSEASPSRRGRKHQSPAEEPVTAGRRQAEEGETSHRDRIARERQPAHGRG